MHPDTQHSPPLTGKQANAAISVIIPCRNEEESLPQLLQQLQKQRNIRLQIIVADGDSEDATVSCAQQLGAEVCISDAGRGRQMNAGAELARHAWLLFLHADSRLTSPSQLADACECIIQASQQGDPKSIALAGHFGLEFIDANKSQKRWRVLEYKSTIQLPLTINGDQGLLIHQDYLAQLGGFSSEHGFLEDQKIAHQIHQTGQWILLPHKLQTSARRFQVEGFRQRCLLMALIMLAWIGGLGNFLSPSQTYPEQRQSKPLNLAKHIERFFRLSWQLPLRQRIRFYWKIADVARSNLYQPFIWLDAQLNLNSWPISRSWSKTGQIICDLPLLRQLLQIGLMPVFPIIATSLLLTAKITALFTTQSSSN